MSKGLQVLDKIHRKIEIFGVYVAAVLVLITMVLTTLEVILRKFFSTGIVGLFEWSSLMMVGIALLGVSYVQQLKQHISVDFISGRVSPSFLYFLDLFVYCLGFVLTAIFCWRGFLNFFDSVARNEYTIGMINFPLWPGKLLAAVAMFIVAVRFLLDIVMHLVKPADYK